MSRPTVILDSWSGELHAKYKDTFSHCTFSSIEPPALQGTEVHPHGGHVASCYASNFSHNKDVVFVRIFNEEGRFAAGVEDDWWFDVVRDVAPSCLICSWGAPDSDDSLTELFLEGQYDEPWVDTFNEMIDTHDIEVFFAAGNSDMNDLDVDTEYPQRYLHGDRVHITGACDYRGVPAYFSSDGVVDSMYIGVHRAVLDPITGEWMPINGTSFANPDAAGDAEANNVRLREYVDYIKEHATVAPGFEDQLPHPKAGYGAMVRRTQANLAATGIYPRQVDRRRVAFYEFNRLS